MIIKYQDDYCDDVVIDTDAATRRELTKACVKLKRENDLISEYWGTREAALEQCGLEFQGEKVRVEIVDLRACAWFEKALAAYRAQETINSRVSAALATRKVFDSEDEYP